MNFRLILCLLLVGAAYTGFIYAHHRFDRRAQEESGAEKAGFDASLLVQDLMRAGANATPQVRRKLRDYGEGSEAFAALLPKADEPWIARVRELEKRGPGPSNLARNLHVSFPRGLQVDKPKSLQVNREGVGTAWVSLVEIGDDKKASVVASFSVRVNVPQNLPESVELKDGHRYELKLSHGEGRPQESTDGFTILTPQARQEMRARLATLRKHIKEVPQLLFMQISVSMSMGLYDNAVVIFDHLMKRLGDRSNLGAGLVERLVYLYEHRRGLVQVNEALIRLKKLR